MIVTTAELYKVAYGEFAVGAYNIENREFDFRPPGKTFQDEYAKFIAHKNEKLGSAHKLAEVHSVLGK